MSWLSSLLRRIGNWVESLGRRLRCDHGATTEDSPALNPDALPSERVQRHRKMRQLIRSKEQMQARRQGKFVPQNEPGMVPLQAHCRACEETFTVKKIEAEAYRAAPLEFQNMVERFLHQHRRMDCPGV